MTAAGRLADDTLTAAITAYRGGMVAAIVRILSAAHGDDVAQAVATGLGTSRQAAFLLRVRLGAPVEDAVTPHDCASIVDHHWSLFAPHFAGDRDVLRRMRLIAEASANEVTATSADDLAAADVAARLTDMADLLDQVGASAAASGVRDRSRALVQASVEASITELQQMQRCMQARAEEQVQATEARLSALEGSRASAVRPRRTPRGRVDPKGLFDSVPLLTSLAFLVTFAVAAAAIWWTIPGGLWVLSPAVDESSGPLAALPAVDESSGPLAVTPSSVAWRVSGRGDAVQSATLGDGLYAVTVSVEDNRRSRRSANFIVVIAVEGGREWLANEIASSWEGTSLVMVGDPASDTPTSGAAMVEVQAAGEWTVEFSPAPGTAPAAEAHALSGHGQGVRFVTLGEGSYVVTAHVSGNGTPRDPERFTIRLSGTRGNEPMASGQAAVWGGSSLVTVGGSASDDLAPGIAAVEVRAAGEWTIEFSPAP
ncbi:MAG: accessory factor UbiK family protein [Chloroflexi bacterium]|nr:accessory factor UbiK family protein [Chloroflexota bacterium]MYE31227.1 accessory factor UbiK family protein [Chloroflexota bacterium]